MQKKNGVKSFSRHINFNPTNYGHVVGKRQSAPSVELIGAIIKVYPELNVHWLINGEGEMLLEESEKKTSYEIEKKVSTLMNEVLDLKTELRKRDIID